MVSGSDDDSANAAAPQPAFGAGHDALIGLVIDDRYAVRSRMARGGMASVYIAEDERLGRPVALKIMHPHLAQSEQFTARFRQEARAAARISNPGVVPVYDQGVFHGQGYLVMELIDGPDLRAFLSGRPTDLGEALAITKRILTALTSAHRAGVTHRDLKPENVLVASDGTLKITDFGLARAASEVTLSSTGTILGTVAYLAPEVALRGDADARTDVYAVGTMLFEMLTGDVPGAQATNPVQLALSRVSTDAPKPSSLQPWIPQQVDALVEALCARDPDSRPDSAGRAAELVQETIDSLDAEELSHLLPQPDADRLGPAGPGQTEVLAVAQATRLMPALPQGQEAQNLVHTSGSVSPPERRNDGKGARGALIVITALIVVAGIALGVWWWWQEYGPGAYIDVPALAGQDVNTAGKQLSELGLAYSVEEENSDDVPRGVVIRTTPEGGARAHKSDEVTVIASAGVLTRVVPTVESLGLQAAKNAVSEAGLSVGQVSEEWSDTQPAGYVIGSEPIAGASVDHRTEIHLIVSKGSEPVPIPDVLGAPFEQAKQTLEDLGLRVADAEDYSNDYGPGTVSAVSPAVGQDAHKGDTVSLTRSLGSEFVTVPSVYGMSREEAVAQLTQAGLDVEVFELANFFNTVGTQSLDAGTEVRRGSTITITVV